MAVVRQIGLLVAAALLLSVIFLLEFSSTTTSSLRSRLSSPPNFSSLFGEEVETAPTRDTVHVLFGLSGNQTGFLAEFEVALKSVLLNAPLDQPMDVHVLADETAFAALSPIFANAELSEWHTRWPLRIVTYNVQSQINEWMYKVDQNFLASGGLTRKPSSRNGQYYSMHTQGTWFRLFAHQVLPATVQHAIYMDTDVVILSNLQDLWRHTTTEYSQHCHFHWGQSQCAGFMILNLAKIPNVWNHSSTATNLYDLARSQEWNLDDQLIFKAVNRSHPQTVCVLPKEWDLSVADPRIWRRQNRALTHVGMLHFNGGSFSQASYFESKLVTDKAHQGSFGIVNYYVHLPWSWAKFVAASQINRKKDGFHEGCLLALIHNTT